MAKSNPKLSANKRELLGRKVRQLRKVGLMPATMYGKGFEAESIQVNFKDFQKIYDHVGESGLVDIDMGEKLYPVLFRNPQYHPVWGELVHVDCYRVNLKEKIVTTVPLELIGESPIVKAGNILVPVTEEIEIEALPTDLPEKIEVDISGMDTLESMITVADLIVDRTKIEIKTDAEQVIVKVEEPKEEVIEEVATEVGDVPAMEQKTPEELAAKEAAEKEEKKDK